MKIILKPIRRDPWSGVIRYKNCHLTIGTYFTRSGSLYTGLSKEEASEMEGKLGYPEGHLGPNSPFWETYIIKSMGDAEISLDTDNPHDELKYLFLRNHKRVRNGYGDNSKVGAEYVMVNIETEAEEKNKVNKIKREAIAILGKLSVRETRQALRLLGFNSDDMSQDMAENTLFDHVERNPQKFLDRWVNNKNKLVEFLVEQAVSKNVLRKNKNVYKYGTEVIGHSMEDTIDYIMNPKNQELRLAIEQETEAKYKANI
jgi:hypothetical protein